MKKYYLNFILLFLVSIFICTICSCVPNRYTTIERQTEYHERVSDIEQYVLAEMGYYIAFDEPVFENNNAYLYIFFVTDYTMDEEECNRYPLIKAADDTRLLLNQYLSSNPDCFLLDYTLRVNINIAPDHSRESSSINRTVASFSNALYDQTDRADILCSVSYTEFLNSGNVALIDGTGIRQIDLSWRINDSGEVLSIIDQLPEVETVLVKEDLVDELSGERDNISFIGR